LTTAIMMQEILMMIRRDCLRIEKEEKDYLLSLHLRLLQIIPEYTKRFTAI